MCTYHHGKFLISVKPGCISTYHQIWFWVSIFAGANVTNVISPPGINKVLWSCNSDCFLVCLPVLCYIYRTLTLCATMNNFAVRVHLISQNLKAPLCWRWNTTPFFFQGRKIHIHLMASIKVKHSWPDEEKYNVITVIVACMFAFHTRSRKLNTSSVHQTLMLS